MRKPSEKLEALFEAAVALETDAQRADYLNRACPDPQLRQEVEALLEAHRHPDSLFAEPTVRVETTPAEGVGTLIGRYKLLEALGEGGFGAVWLAEQKEPVRRKVALKVIKLGMDTTVLRYTQCPPGGAVELWTVNGGGHVPTDSSEFRFRLVDWLLAHPKP